MKVSYKTSIKRKRDILASESGESGSMVLSAVRSITQRISCNLPLVAFDCYLHSFPLLTTLMPRNTLASITLKSLSLNVHSSILLKSNFQYLLKNQHKFNDNQFLRHKRRQSISDSIIDKSLAYRRKCSLHKANPV